MYSVVGCSDCQHLWVVEGRPETTQRCWQSEQPTTEYISLLTTSQDKNPGLPRAIVFSEERVASFGSDGSVSERPLPLAGCASLRAADGRACVGSLRERSAPFEVPPGIG